MDGEEMEVFKDRLLEFVGSILMIIFIPFIIIFPFWLLNLIHKDLGNYIVIGIFLLSIIGMVCKFIYWLFVEPFKKIK